MGQLPQAHNQRATQDYFSRVLEEVKEGKRNFLRIVAHPKLSNIPRAVSLDTSLSVTVASKSSYLKFNIMSQQIQTCSRSPSPVKKPKALPFEALQCQTSSNLLLGAKST